MPRLRMIIDTWFILVGGACMISVPFMFVSWLYYLWKDDPSIADIGWTASIGCASWGMYICVPELGVRQWVLTLCVTSWSLRLLVLSSTRMIKGERDERYLELSSRWKRGLRWKYFKLFQAQASSVAILVIPFALAYLAPELSWTAWDTAGCIVFVIGLFGEAMADQQKNRFKNSTEAQTSVCNIGLWRYSRHPNFFFEWIIWISFALFGMNHPYGFVGWLSPIFILISLLKATSGFIPLPPRTKK